MNIHIELGILSTPLIHFTITETTNQNTPHIQTATGETLLADQPEPDEFRIGFHQ